MLSSSARKKNGWFKDEMVHNVLTAVIVMLKITPSMDIDAGAVGAKLTQAQTHTHTVPFDE